MERGTHSELVKRKEHYNNFLQFHHGQRRADESFNSETTNGKPSLGSIGRKSSSLSSSPSKRTKAAEELESIVQKLTEDDTNYKFAGLKSYLIYIQSAAGYCFATLVFLAFAAFVFCQLFTQVWLQRWVDLGDGNYVSLCHD